MALLVLVLASACGRDGTSSGNLPRDTYLVAVRANSGDEIWAARPPILCPDQPTVVNNQLFIGGVGQSGTTYASNDGTLVAFDRATGAEEWRSAARSSVSCPPQQVFGIAAVSGSIAAVSVGEGVSGLDVKTGVERWSAALKADGALINTGDLVLVPAGQDIHALDSQTGRERWRSTSTRAQNTQRFGDPVANSTSVFYVVADQQTEASNKLVALDLATGSVDWQADLPPGKIRSPLLTDEDVVVTSIELPEAQRQAAGSATRVTLGIDSRNGRELWRREIGGADAALVDWVAFADHTVYVMSNTPFGRGLEALDARTGVRRWVTQDLAGTREFIAAGDQLVVLGNGGDNPRPRDVTPQNGSGMTVLALDDTNGAHIWKRTLLQAPQLFDTYPPDAIGSIVDGVLYIASTVATIDHELPGPD